MLWVLCYRGRARRPCSQSVRGRRVPTDWTDWEAGHAMYGLQDRLTDVRNRHPEYAITFDRASHRWRADSPEHVVVEETLDDLGTTLSRDDDA